MRIPLWVGGPVVIALSAVDATLELQGRAVRGLARTVIGRMSNGEHARLADPAWTETVTRRADSANRQDQPRRP